MSSIKWPYGIIWGDKDPEGAGMSLRYGMTMWADALQSQNRELRAKVKELESAQNNATQTKVCHWELEDDDQRTYQGECGVLWYIPDGDPKENTMNYCPECGGVLLYSKREGE